MTETNATAEVIQQIRKGGGMDPKFLVMQRMGRMLQTFPRTHKIRILEWMLEETRSEKETALGQGNAACFQ